MTTSAATDPLPRRLGDFDIVGVLGQGGSGVVYDARWGHREIALKVLHPALVATSKERDQFLAEARRLSEIAHAGVVKVLSVGELDGRPYLAMEKLDGETLAARLARGRLDVAVALRLFAQLADAVAALHARELVHRDLKPENIVLVRGPDGEHAVLLDFGIAKSLAEPASTTTSDGGVRGTPAYMAPERFFGSPASIATDVYELAVVLFAMLAGRLPWDDCGDPDVRLNPLRLADVAPDLPPALDVEVARALSTRGANRPAGARAFADAVHAALGEGAPVAVASSPSGRMTAEVRPQPTPPAWFDAARRTPPHSGELAVAPTVHARPRRRRAALWIVLALVGLLGAGIAIAVIATRGGSAPAAAVAGTTTDPWATPGAASGSGTGSAESPPPGERPLRAEMGAALGHFPHDTKAVVALDVDELRNDPDLGPFVLDDPRVKELGGMLDLTGCKVDFARVTDWGAVGISEHAEQLDAIVSGRWPRDAIEACLGGATRAEIQHLVQGGVPLTRLHGPAGDRWLAWLDDRTFFLTTRTDVDAAWLVGRVHATDGPGGVIAQLAPQLDRDATGWALADATMMEKSDAITIPPGHVIARAVLDDGLDIKVRIRYADAKAAADALAAIDQRADATINGARDLGIVHTETHDDVVDIRIKLGRFLLHGMLSK